MQVRPRAGGDPRGHVVLGAASRLVPVWGCAEEDAVLEVVEQPFGVLLASLDELVGLVDEQDVAVVELGEEPVCAGGGDGSGDDEDLAAHGAGGEEPEGCLADPGGAGGDEDVVHGLLAGLGGLGGEPDLVLGSLLADEAGPAGGVVAVGEPFGHGEWHGVPPCRGGGCGWVLVMRLGEVL
jgi:hypothetical protein